MAWSAEGAFPWQVFTFWLREGAYAARILNKFMLAQTGRALPVNPEEMQLLLAAVEVSANDHQSVLTDMVRSLEQNTTYKVISEEQIRLLWVALMEYGTRSKHFESMRGPLEAFVSQTDGLSSGAFVTNLAGCIWRTLGPAMAPDPRMIEGKES